MSSSRGSSLRHLSMSWPCSGALVLLALQGCGTVPPSRPTAPVEPAATASRPGNAPAVERQWLQSWFKGTPVAIVQRDDSTVSVDVPREFCFEVGRSSVKPALAAVLDKLAESLRRNPTARLGLLAAPSDAAPSAPLALQRASQVRAHLLSRGVASARLGSPTATAGAAVQLRLDFAMP